MASQEQIVANRRNARKSTGPRTAEGKARVARNAVKHGLLSREVVLTTEDMAEFEAFRDGMMADLRPAGALECLLADQVAASAWRLARVLRCLRERLERDFDAAIDNWHETTAKRKAHNPQCKDLRPVTLGVALTTGFTADLPYQTLHRYEAQIERSMYKALRELHRVQAGRANGREEAPDHGRRVEAESAPHEGECPQDSPVEGDIAKQSQPETRHRPDRDASGRGGRRNAGLLNKANPRSGKEAADGKPAAKGRATGGERPRGRAKGEIAEQSQSGGAGTGGEQGRLAAPGGCETSG